MNKFESRIKEIRIENNLTYSQLASEFGKSEGAIRAWESGRTNPDVDTVIALAKRFNTSTDYLLGASDTKKPQNEDISKRLGLSEKAVEILEYCMKEGGKENSFTLTINNLIEDKNLLSIISQYLYYELETDSEEALPTDDNKPLYPIVAKYKYLKDFEYKPDGSIQMGNAIDASSCTDFIDDDKYKKIVLLQIQEALMKLLEKENSTNHF